MPPKSELERIDLIRRALAPSSQSVKVGIGDDTAVVASPQDSLLLGTDLMIEGVHFDFAYCSAADLGHKSLATALSDIAAMGGQPLYALFSIALPKKTSDTFLEEFYASARSLAHLHKVEIVGGDLSASRNDLFIDVTCVGSTDRAILRSTAQIGDVLAVSGTPGASAAGLQILRDPASNNVALAELSRAHLRPVPRFDLDTSNATSLIDVSDGLASEVHHLAEASQVGFEIEEAKLPLSKTAVSHFGRERALDFCLHGGEDYELLATFPAHSTIPTGFNVIGRATRAPEIVLLKTNGERVPLARKGFDHFA